MIGQPMDASGFDTLASLFPDRTVITYDPRGLGRSTRKDGRVDNTPTLQAGDVHAVIEALGAGPGPRQPWRAPSRSTRSRPSSWAHPTTCARRCAA